MKLKQLFLLAVALVMLTMVLASCELPFDLPFDVPFLGGGETTTAATTTDAATTTTGALITLPAVTAKPNPIVEVKKVSEKIRLIHKNNTVTSIEAKLEATDIYNAITYTHSLDKESGILTLVLSSDYDKNNALSALVGEVTTLTVRIRESNKKLEWAYEGREEWTVLCSTGDTNGQPLTALREATGFGEKVIALESHLAATEEYNGVVHTPSYNAESGILTLTMYDRMVENIALIHLQKDLPAPLTVCLRKNGDNLEWAYPDSDAWTLLCSATDTTATPLALLREATDFARHTMPEDNGVTFVISGNNLRFRARMWQNEGYDICTDAWLNSPGITENNNFMHRWLSEIPSTTADASMEKGDVFKTASDEIPSIFMNGTYIAAKHGYYVISSVPNMGFTEADIGLVFTRASDNQQYVLVKVPNDKAWFCPFDEDVMKSGDFTPYAYAMNGALKSGDELNYTVKGKKKTVTVSADSTHEQFRSSTNHCIQHAYLNGTVEVDLTQDGVYNADFVDFYEKYSVLYLPTVLEHLMDNVGDNTNASCNDESLDEHYLSFIQVHRFHKNGSFTMYQTVEFHRDLTGVYYFGVMSEAFPVDEQYVYAPGATNCGTPTLHVKGTGTFYAQGDATIRSFFQFADAGCKKGMNVGYYPYFEVATDEVRPEMLQNHGKGIGEWSNIGKMYPYLYNVPSVSDGDSFSFIGYHVPTVRFDDDFFAINWYFVGDDIYLSMHTDKAVAERTVAIPNAEYLIGLSITVDEASAGFTVASDTVTADGITVSTTGAGYVTLKLTKQ